MRQHARSERPASTEASRVFVTTNLIIGPNGTFNGFSPLGSPRMDAYVESDMPLDDFALMGGGGGAGGGADGTTVPEPHARGLISIALVILSLRRAIRANVRTDKIRLLAAGITCMSMTAIVASATPISMTYGTLTGHIDPLTYTDAQGTATTGPIALSLSNSGLSFGQEDLAAGTFFDRLVMDAQFNDGRGNVQTGVITLTLGGLLGPTEMPTISDSDLTGAGPFAGSTFTGMAKRAHGKNCSEGGWCWTFLKPPGVGFEIHLPVTFDEPRDVSVSGYVEVHIPEPSTFVQLASGVLVAAIARRFGRTPAAVT